MFLGYIVMQSSAAVKLKIKNLPLKREVQNQNADCCALLRFAALVPAVCGKIKESLHGLPVQHG
jgi:hypothetical protein